MELMDADSVVVALALLLAWLAVPLLLPLAEGEGQLAVAEAVCDTLIVGVWEAVRQRVGVGEVHGETESEGLFEALTETVRECEALALLLAWLAVMEPLPVAEGESQLAVAETDAVALTEGVRETEEQGVTVRDTEGEAVREGHPVELPEAVREGVAVAVWLAWLAVTEALPEAEGESQLAVAEGDCDPVVVGVCEAVEDSEGVCEVEEEGVPVRQRVGVCDTEGEDERVESSEGLPEAVDECVPLLVWLAKLAVGALLAVARREGQLAVEETEGELLALALLAVALALAVVLAVAQLALGLALEEALIDAQLAVADTESMLAVAQLAVANALEEPLREARLAVATEALALALAQLAVALRLAQLAVAL